MKFRFRTQPAFPILGYALVVVSSISCAIPESIFRGPVIVAIGDWNGDGFTDMAVGDYGQTRVRILSGLDGAVIRTLKGAEDFGWSLCALERPKTQSLALAVSSPKAGRITVFCAEDSNAMTVINRAESLIGWSMSGTRDLDGDGIGDLVVGIPEYLESGKLGEGSCLIVSSTTGQTLTRLKNTAGREALGFAVAAVPDLNRDEAPDFLVGLWSNPRVLLYSGHDGKFLRKFASAEGGIPWNYPICASSLDLSSFRLAIGNPDAGRGGAVVVFDRIGSEVVKLLGSAGGSRFGFAIAWVPGTDTGKVSKLLIGAPGFIRGGGLPMIPIVIESEIEDCIPGYVRLYSGDEGKLIWEASRKELGDWFGISVCAISDIDRDGVADVAIAGQRHESRSVFVTALSGSDGKLIYKVNLSKW